jgi:putative hydrolase of the HAD superfamily
MFTDLKPKAVLFDFYETLLNIRTDEEDPAVWDKLARYLQYQGISIDAGALQQAYVDLAKQRLEQNHQRFPEINVYSIFQKILSDKGHANSTQLITSTAQLFRVLSIRHFELFSDTLLTLQTLRQNYTIGLITDAQRVFLEPEIQITGLQSFFDVMIVSSDYDFHKPDPRMFTMALEKIGVAPEQALYVGDSWSRDIVGAQSVGIQAILLNRKNHAHNFTGAHKPFKTIRSLDELRHGGLFYTP